MHSLTVVIALALAEISITCIIVVIVIRCGPDAIDEVLNVLLSRFNLIMNTICVIMDVIIYLPSSCDTH